MASSDLSWTVNAGKLEGPGFERFQVELAKYNGRQLEPGFPTNSWREDLEEYGQVKRAEGEYIEAVRGEVASLVADIPSDVDNFIDWFEDLKETGPGQGDHLFPWLAEAAGRDDMLWFLTQEVAGEAGFDDLLALTQVKMPVTAKLEMARNYWDEMGRGRDTAMHGPLLERLANYLQIDAKPDHVVPEVPRARQCDARLGAKPSILLSLDRRPWRDRDDRAHASLLCRCWAKASPHPYQKAPVLHFARHPRHQAFRMLEPRGAAVAGCARSALRSGNRRRSHHSAVAWRPLFRSLSPPLRCRPAAQSGGVGLEESEHALSRGR